jgi:hypothetical protein
MTVHSAKKQEKLFTVVKIKGKKIERIPSDTIISIFNTTGIDFFNWQ